MKNRYSQNQKTKNCFYICGLTGGPFFPIPAILEQVENKIQNTKPILIGVKNSYESELSKQLNYSIEYLPKAKLDILSFNDLGFLEYLQGLYGSIISIFLLAFSFVKCISLMLKYKPILIYSTGSFLAVPMLWAAKITNILRLTNTKLIVHQQDATVGLANRLTANLADLQSCVFQYTKDKYPQFQNAELIPNPIITSKYDLKNTWQDKQLEAFVKNKETNKPLLLIFGGGSGALAINNWVTENIKELLNEFRVIHLTGILQREKERVILSVTKDTLLEEYTTQQISNYFTQPSVLQDMPLLLASADLVICRAGLGSISEMSLLNKPTFLVPLPNSHQEQNAELISQTYSNFQILSQEYQNSWLSFICNTIFNFSKNTFDQPDLNIYYSKIIALIDK